MLENHRTLPMQTTSSMRFRFKWRVIALLLAFGYSVTFLRFISFSSPENSRDSVANPSKIPRPDIADTNHFQHNVRAIHGIHSANMGENKVETGAESSQKKPAAESDDQKDANSAAVKSAPSLLHQIKSRATGREEWQDVFKSHMYVYSAYHDPRQQAVIVIGMVQAKRTGTTAKCALWYRHSPEEPQLTPANILVVPNPHLAPYLAATIKCPLADNHTVPDYVSLYVRAATLQQWQIETTGNLLPVVNNGPRGQDSRASDGIPAHKEKAWINAKDDWASDQWNRASKQRDRASDRDAQNHEFTVCVIPLYGEISSYQLVEFIEVNSLFHSEHFIFYNSSTSSGIRPYLQYYVDQGLVSVHKWDLPPDIQKQTPEHGHLAALHDCLYRSMFTTKYLVVLDINEMLVPTSAISWPQLFQDKFLLKNINVTGGFSVQTVLFSDMAESVYSSHPMVQKYNIQSLLHTYRENKIHNHRDRSRIVVLPERVSQIGANFVHKFIDKKFHTFDVPYSHGLLFSYQKGAGLIQKGAELSEKDKKIREQSYYVIEEARMNTFAMDIIDRISKVCGEIYSKT